MKALFLMLSVRFILGWVRISSIPWCIVLSASLDCGTLLVFLFTAKYFRKSLNKKRVRFKAVNYLPVITSIVSVIVSRDAKYQTCKSAEVHNPNDSIGCTNHALKILWNLQYVVTLLSYSILWISLDLRECFSLQGNRETDVIRMTWVSSLIQYRYHLSFH